MPLTVHKISTVLRNIAILSTSLAYDIHGQRPRAFTEVGAASGSRTLVQVLQHHSPLKAFTQLLRDLSPAGTFKPPGGTSKALFSPNRRSRTGASPAALVDPQSYGQLPRLVAFDLDGTLWQPDMYMLWGGGAPFTKQKDGSLRDSAGESVTLLGQTREILHSLRAPAKGDVPNPWSDTVIAYVSCTDEPTWADECATKFDLGDGMTVKSVVDIEEIYKDYKKAHFEQLHRKTGIAYEDMMFFDNEMHNIKNVMQLGVRCYHAPKGMTEDLWERALEDYNTFEKLETVFI